MAQPAKIRSKTIITSRAMRRPLLTTLVTLVLTVALISVAIAVCICVSVA